MMELVTITKPEIEIDNDLKELVFEEHERMTIVHCSFRPSTDRLIRIWPTTYLVQDDGIQLKLIKAFNISLYPQWTIRYLSEGDIRFTLVFEGLRRTCTGFFLFEDIPKPDGFYSEWVKRNSTDVYEVVVKS